MLKALFKPRIKLNQVTHIKKTLGGSGNFLISVGQEITPSDLLGKYQASSGFFAIDLSKKLGVAPSQTPKYMAKAIGAKIYKGEVLALKQSLFGKNYITSPTDGVIESCDPATGECRLKIYPQSINLTSGVYGIVDYIDKTTGDIYIKCQVTKIYGAVGLGRPRAGILKILGSESDLIHPEQITPNLTGHILVCGALADATLIDHALKLSVHALITGGVNHQRYKEMINKLDIQYSHNLDQGLSILSLEGFGPIPIDKTCLDLMRSFQGNFAYIEGFEKALFLPSLDPSSINSLRKVSLPINQTIQPEINEVKSIEIGQTVKIIWPTALGVTGTVSAIDQAQTVLPSGIKTYLLTITTKSRKIKIPYQNIQIV